MSRFAENFKVLPILAPADIVATATATQYVDLNLSTGIVELAVHFGAIASTDSTGEVVVTVECANVGDTSSTDLVEGAIAFNYRLSAAVGTDSMGDITAATTAGAAVANTNDNKTLLVFIDPAVAAATVVGGRYVRAVITPTAEITSTVVGAVARFVPRYAGNAIPSST